MVTAIEDISKAIQKYTTKQPIAGSIGADKTTSEIFNHAELPNDVKDRYLDKGNPQILMNGDTMKKSILEYLTPRILPETKL